MAAAIQSISSGAALLSLADNNWKEVVVKKKDSNGDIVVRDGKTEITYVMDVRTGDLYIDDPKWLIAAKCLALTVGTPFFTAAQMVWNGGKTFVDIYSSAKQAIEQSGKLFKEHKTGEGIAEIVKGFLWEVPKGIVKNLWNIVRAPFYAIAVMFASAYGTVCNTYEGRKLVAQIEHSWQHNVSREYDFRKTLPDPRTDCWTEFLYGVKHSKAFYLAWCFQVRHNIKDPNMIVVKG